MTSHSITAVNHLPQAEFVRMLGDVFEETPAVAASVYLERPFADTAELHQKMVAAVEQMSPAQQLALIRAHPELGANVEMAEASVQEQAGAGLSQLDAAEYEQLQVMNAAYREKFGFPFVMAVKGYGKTDILAAFSARLKNEPQVERTRSLSEIAKIARFRLDDLIE